MRATCNPFETFSAVETPYIADDGSGAANNAFLDARSD